MSNYCAQVKTKNCGKVGPPCRIMKQGRLKGRCGPRATPLTDLQKQLLTGQAPAPGGPGIVAQLQEAGAGLVDTATGAARVVTDAIGATTPDVEQEVALVAARVLTPTAAAFDTGLSVGRIKELRESRRAYRYVPRRKKSSRRRRKRKTSSRRRKSKRRPSKRRKSRRRSSKRRSHRRSRKSR